jgi:hypothetical protein
MISSDITSSYIESNEMLGRKSSKSCVNKRDAATIQIVPCPKSEKRFCSEQRAIFYGFPPGCGSGPFKGSPHRKGCDDLDRPLRLMRAMGDTGTAKPAFLRIHEDGRLSFLGIGYEGIAHADLHTPSAPVTHLFIEINMSKCHAFSFPSLSLL